jgi:large subunit ribosomal protein L22
MIDKSMKVSSATTRYIRIGPTKFERLLSKIRGQSYKEAMDVLKSTHEKVAAVIWKTVYSATSNAREKYKCKRELLLISEAFINNGPMLKRMRPRAKGRAAAIQKKFSHLTIRVSVLPELPKQEQKVESSILIRKEVDNEQNVDNTNFMLSNGNEEKKEEKYFQDFFNIHYIPEITKIIPKDEFISAST